MSKPSAAAANTVCNNTSGHDQDSQHVILHYSSDWFGQERKMSFFDKIDNYFIVNAIKEVLKGRDPKESLPDSV